MIPGGTPWGIPYSTKKRLLQHYSTPKWDLATPWQGVHGARSCTPAGAAKLENPNSIRRALIFGGTGGATWKFRVGVVSPAPETNTTIVRSGRNYSTALASGCRGCRRTLGGEGGAHAPARACALTRRVRGQLGCHDVCPFTIGHTSWQQTRASSARRCVRACIACRSAAPPFPPRPGKFLQRPLPLPGALE